jgi:RNA polymerase sigma-70 factor (ECF subfamily)
VADRDDNTAGKTPDALREALVGAAPAVRGFLFGLCGDWHEAEDLAQDSLLAAWGGRAGFDGRCGVRTWLFAIARNRWIDRLRRGRAREGLRTMELTPTISSNTPAPATTAGRNEFADALAAAITRLPGDQREALMLRENSGLSFTQMADVLHLPAATVKSRVRYALLKLAEELKPFRSELES